MSDNVGADKAVDAGEEAAAAPSAVPLGPDGQPLSKKKQKRLAKLGGVSGLEEFWKKKKEAYKQRQKEKKAQVREEREAEWQALTEEERAAKKQAADEHWAKVKEEKEALKAKIDAQIAKKAALPQVVIDCDYEEVQDDKGIKSMASQISYAHSHVRREALPCWMHLVGLKPGGKLEQSLKSKDNFANWHLTATHDPVEKAVPDVVDSDTVTYLSGDSENTIDTVEGGKYYIVGGLVDRNKHKGIAHKRAQALNVRTAKFPLEAYLQRYPEKAGICKTLTTFHVVQVLCGVAAGESWDTAFDSILPKRNTEEVAAPKRKPAAESDAAPAAKKQKPAEPSAEEGA
eukprot:TRINITY_DN22070_c0_g1_i1.p1 TRINITY_DN22070_c0_g1~~TRINITY_DN22070_c0_g1_i1.p1  ORF type:complete len:344 (+),score=174.83 TRINITY_DN22070_c0_g1_i1:78-1109(+)